jgi:hypothetical protein
MMTMLHRQSTDTRVVAVFFLMLCTHYVHVRTMGFAVSFESCSAVHKGFMLLAMF